MDQDCFDIIYEGNRILAGTRIFGHLKSEKDICLEGTIEGNVFTKGRVIINRGGVIEGDVECGELYVQGIIIGEVKVTQKTVMGASAEIRGRLITTCLEITPGAKIEKGLRLNHASK